MAEPAALAPREQRRKLRVALIADAPLQPDWVTEAFAKIAAVPFAEIVLVGLTAPRARPRPAPALVQLYAKLDRAAFGAPVAPPADLRRLVTPQRLALDPQEALLGALDLDVVFVVGELDERRYAAFARLGAWRFWFGDAGGAEPLAGFPEIGRNAPLTGSGILVRRASDEPPRVICQSWTRTNPWSLARTRDRVLPKTAEFVYRALREIYLSGPTCLDFAPPAAGVGQPLDIGAAGSVWAIGGRLAQLGIERALDVEQWLLAFRFGPQGALDADAVPADLRGFTRLVPPKGRTWADPFPLEKNGRYFVFFEELPSAEGKAHIAMIELKRDGSHSQPVRVLERPYHLSYPFLLEHAGQLLMVPETQQNGTVEVYRCIDFPLQWRREQVLLDGARCVDATFHQEGERWWMFVNQAADGSGMLDDELHVYYASRFLGPWCAHARNPVKSDARCARPAGALYRRGGHLYRPAQICVPRYGAGLCLHRVLRLTPHEYAERQVAQIVPAPRGRLLGLHTLNRAGALTVVDALARRSRFLGSH